MADRNVPIPPIELIGERRKWIPSVSVMTVLFATDQTSTEEVWAPIAKVRRCSRLQRVALSYFLKAEQYLIARALVFELGHEFVVLHPWQLAIADGDYEITDAIELQRNS